ncbi:hypothetical protein CFK62_02990 [Streptococcus agalactiae]|nr:hypothetical protein M3M_00335 [Streptococcus agalactiae STIR-CD-17]EPU02583.1 hypothetical protein SAG0123_00910 [Streptococcus agalactiae STIR-CD-13]EPU03858.1 hypothetical protein SAG0122_04950 [Streptococcus agalactiae STIR-CD-09]EPW81288.1 hypothetical protein SAG0121_00775 [Streptococcus agalactiae STIR-CD-07]OZV88934.1 hypothetical protein CFK62_02990 [Streptococcus agalactiae]
MNDKEDIKSRTAITLNKGWVTLVFSKKLNHLLLQEKLKRIKDYEILVKFLYHLIRNVAKRELKILFQNIRWMVILKQKKL